MARTSFTSKMQIEATRKKTSIGGNDAMIKTSSMNKSKRSAYKKYRGQGR